MSRTLFSLAAIGFMAVAAAAEPPVPTVSAGEYLAVNAANPALVYNDPPALVADGWEEARCATIEYAPGVKADVYWPATPGAGPLPVVLVAFYYNRAFFVSGSGKGWRELVPAIIWMAEIANRGFLVVCPDPLSTARDMAAAMKWLAERGPGLGADPSRMALFSVSSNPKIIPYLMTLPEAANVKAMALYYGDLIAESWALPKDVALHVVKAGKDNAVNNNRIDGFVRKFTEAGNPVEFITYANGKHAFDWIERGGEAAEVMEKTLDFLEARLR